MSSVVIAGDTSGTVTLDAPAVAGTTTLTLPATSGTVMVNGPAFSAYLQNNTAIANLTATKIPCNIEEFDTNSNYDNTTNYRFTPTVAGYYQVNGRFAITGASSTLLIIDVFKNGSAIKRGVDLRSTQTSGAGVSVNCLVYLNGSSDYIEIYAVVDGTSVFIEGASTATYFQAAMVRSA